MFVPSLPLLSIHIYSLSTNMVGYLQIMTVVINYSQTCQYYLISV